MNRTYRTFTGKPPLSQSELLHRIADCDIVIERMERRGLPGYAQQHRRRRAEYVAQLGKIMESGRVAGALKEVR